MHLFSPGIIGSAPPRVNAVNFDGTNDYLTRGADLDGVSDGSEVLISARMRFTGSASDNEWIFNIAGNTVGFLRNAADVFSIIFGSVGYAQGMSAEADGTWDETDGFIHYLGYFNTNAAAGARTHDIYINDAEAYNSSGFDYGGAFNIDLTGGDVAIGAATDASGKVSLDLADLLIWFGVTHDITVEANRRLFTSSQGRPVPPAVSINALGTPDVALYGATDTWHTNKGSGGGFTENGALTTASGSPSD